MKVYILLDIAEGRVKHAVRMLRRTSGAAIVDLLEGHPDVMVMVEAPDRQRLAESVMPVITSVEGITEDMHMLVTRNGMSHNFPARDEAKRPVRR
jgi:hypothetical protein